MAYNDIRRPVLVACALCGAPATVAFALHVYCGLTLWVALVLTPLSYLPMQAIWFASAVDLLGTISSS